MGEGEKANPCPGSVGGVIPECWTHRASTALPGYRNAPGQAQAADGWLNPPEDGTWSSRDILGCQAVGLCQQQLRRVPACLRSAIIPVPKQQTNVRQLPQENLKSKPRGAAAGRGEGQDEAGICSPELGW